VIDARDAALHAACPTLAVPRFGQLPDMVPGQRVLVAANGLFLQVRTTWLDCVVRIGDVGVALPYGVSEPCIRCAFGRVPNRLLLEFVRWARDALPDEVAGGLVYSATRGTLRMVRFEALSQSPDGIEYRIPVLQGDEVVAVDLHSHGRCAAYFSATDDADDNGIKIAGVFGNLDLAEPTCQFRLVVGRARFDLPSPANLFADAGGKSWNTGSSKNS
jgi:PRTRC genetic system protein A